MAVKNNLYDALEYAGQVEEAAKSHRKERKRKREQGKISADKDEKNPNPGEFLSGFWKEDRLIPSITVTIFFGSEEWDGPLNLDGYIRSGGAGLHRRLSRSADCSGADVGRGNYEIPIQPAGGHVFYQILQR